jgi:hypothetical protein
VTRRQLGQPVNQRRDRAERTNRSEPRVCFSRRRGSPERGRLLCLHRVRPHRGRRMGHGSVLSLYRCGICIRCGDLHAPDQFRTAAADCRRLRRLHPVGSCPALRPRLGRCHSLGAMADTKPRSWACAIDGPSEGRGDPYLGRACEDHARLRHVDRYRHRTRNCIRHSTFDIRHSTFDIRHSTFCAAGNQETMRHRTSAP